MYIPDPIELMEAQAERIMDERFDGENWRCECGYLMTPKDDKFYVSFNPYAPPVCKTCYEKAKQE